MALLDLVNKLIGNLLQGNIYTNQDVYVSKVLSRPSNAGPIPNSDPRLLNIKAGSPHPHTNSRIIPPPQHGPPPQPPGPPHVPGSPSPKVVGPSRVPGTPIPKAPGPAHIPGAPMPNPDLRLLNFGERRTHPHEGSQVIPQSPMHSPPPLARTGMYQISAPPSVRDQANQAPLNREGNTFDTLEQQNSTIADLARFALNVEKQKENLQTNRTPPPGPAQAPYNSPQGSGLNVAKGTGDDYSIKDDVDHTLDGLSSQRRQLRESIYQQSDSAKSPAPLPTQHTLRDGQPQDLTEQLGSQVARPSDIANLFRKGAAFEDVVRRNVYNNQDQAIVSNIGGSEYSRPTLGDAKVRSGQPPAPSLNFQSDNAPPRKELVGPQGTLAATKGHQGGNAFDDRDLAIGGKFASMSQRPAPPQARFGDVFAIAHWLRNVGKEMLGLDVGADPPAETEVNILGVGERKIKGASFIASQFLLASMNPGGILSEVKDTNYSPLNGIWNPLAIVAASLPGRVVHPALAPIVAAPLFGQDYKYSLLGKLATETDVLTTKGLSSIPLDLPGGDSAGLVGDLISQAAPGASQVVSEFVDSLVSTVATDPLDVEFAGEKKELNSTESSGLVEDTPIPDDSIYMPFMFQDLRDPTDTFLYFRAFIKPGLAQTFTTDWQVDRYFGRVDKVPIYTGTDRTLNFSFDVVAWSPKDLKVMYRKLDKLQSMVYPEYDTKGFMHSGPIIRIRVGDLISTTVGGKSTRGLPGYITSLDFAFEDGIWNIENDFRVPRMVTVSMGFTVLHNGNPGVYSIQQLAPGDSSPSSVGDRTFGVGQFSKQNSGETKISVSKAEFSKIFANVRGKKGV